MCNDIQNDIEKQLQAEHGIQYDIRNYTESQLRTAAEVADKEMAIALWKERDWQTYSAIRNALVALIRVGRGDEVARRNLQFICFINAQLLPRFNGSFSDRHMFTCCH